MAAGSNRDPVSEALAEFDQALVQAHSNLEGHFRRDANLLPPPGLVIAEFSSATDALDFQRIKGTQYSVTAGLHLMYAVRVRIPESAAVSTHDADADPRAQTPSELAGGFCLTALTDKGRERLPEIKKLLESIL